jgi:hypothetical protein
MIYAIAPEPRQEGKGAAKAEAAADTVASATKKSIGWIFRKMLISVESGL